MKKILIAVSIVLTFALFFVACKKEDSTAKFDIRLTDGPGDFQQVNIDLQSVEFKTTNDSLKWVTMQIKPTMVDLLHFQNGVDTLIATTTLQPAEIKEVRLILGTKSTLKVDDVFYPLSIPSGSESGLKIKIGKNVVTTTSNSITLDFDAQKSVVKNGKEEYHLKPVISLK
jgi:hypothetical protein